MSRHSDTRTAAPTLRGRRTATLVAALAALVVAGVAVANVFGPAPHDARPIAVSVAGSTRATVTAPTCGQGAAVSPVQLDLSCTANQQIGNLSWNGWGDSTATATGDLSDTACFCVGAPLERYPVVLRFSHAVTRGVDRQYSVLSVSFPKARPAWAYLPAFRFVWTPEGFVSEDSPS